MCTRAKMLWIFRVSFCGVCGALATGGLGRTPEPLAKIWGLTSAPKSSFGLLFVSLDMCLRSSCWSKAPSSDWVSREPGQRMEPTRPCPPPSSPLDSQQAPKIIFETGK